MVTIADIAFQLENLAPSAYAEDYDNVGLLTGEMTWEVKKVLLSLDCTEAIVDEAIAQGCNLIISHHPIVFKGLKSLVPRDYVNRTLIKAVKHDIAIYSIHTNLDAQAAGVNRKLAEKLGLVPESLKVLMPKSGKVLERLTAYVPIGYEEQVSNALFNIGVGQIGNYENCSFQYEGIGQFKPIGLAKPFQGAVNQIERTKEMALDYLVPKHLTEKAIRILLQSHPYEEVAYYLQPLSNANQTVGMGMIGELAKEVEIYDWLDHVKRVLGTGALRHTELCKSKVKKVAVGGGTCSFLTKPAIAAGADVLVTADIKYHEAFDAEGKIILIDAGHFETEQYTGEIIYEVLKQKFPNIAAVFTKVITNPIRYY